MSELVEALSCEIAMFAHSRGTWRPQELADHLARYVVTPALDALVAERVEAAACDEDFVERLTRHIYDHPDGPPPPREWRQVWERRIEDFVRALAAALTERRPTDD